MATAHHSLALQGNRGDERVDRAAANDERKAFATLQALAAMAGCSLRQLDGGGYLICRWRFCKTLPSLDAAAAFLHQIGGPR